MPIIYNSPGERRRYDAFKTLDDAKINPLSEAVRCAVKIEDDIEKIENALKDKGLKSQTKASLVSMLPRLRMSAFTAWKEVAEFVYAKPKAEHFDPEMADAIQKVTNKMQMLELLQKHNYPEKPPVNIKGTNGNGNGAGH